MTLQDFINKYNGKPIDFDGWYGDQCVDLMNQYCVDVLGISNPVSILGGDTAYHIYTNYSGSQFAKIGNTPTGVPTPGDIMFWNPNVSGVTGSAGHVSIFVTGDENNFTSFDQNYPTGSLCHEQNHSYAGVVGWLHGTAVQTTTGTYKGIDLSNTDSIKVCVDTWYDVTHGQYVHLSDVNSICTTLGIPTGSGKDAINAAITKLQKEKADDDQTVANLNKQIPDLEGQISTLNNQVLDLQTQLEAALQSATHPNGIDYKSLYDQAEIDLKGTRQNLADLTTTYNKAVAQYKNTSYLSAPTGTLIQEVVKRITHLK